MLTFRPIKPAYTAGCRLQAIRIHVRDHKLRVLSAADRTLEAHYGDFVWSQARKGVNEAQRLALNVSYGRNPRDAELPGGLPEFTIWGQNLSRKTLMDENPPW
jgi:hypothetical protein